MHGWLRALNASSVLVVFTFYSDIMDLKGYSFADTPTCRMAPLHPLISSFFLLLASFPMFPSHPSQLIISICLVYLASFLLLCLFVLQHVINVQKRDQLLFRIQPTFCCPPTTL